MNQKPILLEFPKTVQFNKKFKQVNSSTDFELKLL